MHCKIAGHACLSNNGVAVLAPSKKSDDDFEWTVDDNDWKVDDSERDDIG